MCKASYQLVRSEGREILVTGRKLKHTFAFCSGSMPRFANASVTGGLGAGCGRELCTSDGPAKFNLTCSVNSLQRSRASGERDAQQQSQLYLCCLVRACWDVHNTAALLHNTSLYKVGTWV